jgi:plastocyanin
MHTSGLVISRRRIVTAALLAVPLAGLGRLVLTDDVQAADIAVDIGSFQFNPSPITISAGTTVVWTNRDTVPHTATSDTQGLFDTGRLQYGQSGKVIVTAAGATTNTSPASNFVRRLGDG